MEKGGSWDGLLADGVGVGPGTVLADGGGVGPFAVHTPWGKGGSACNLALLCALLSLAARPDIARCHWTKATAVCSWRGSDFPVGCHDPLVQEGLGMGSFEHPAFTVP